jgi:hypothetical protein
MPTAVVDFLFADPCPSDHDIDRVQVPDAAMTISDRIRIARVHLPAAEARAKLRHAANGGRRVYRDPGSTPPTKRGRGVRAEEEVAGRVGMSHTSFRRAAEIVVAAEENPEEYGDLLMRMDVTGRVYPAFAELRRRRGHAVPGRPVPRDGSSLARGRDLIG